MDYFQRKKKKNIYLYDRDDHVCLVQATEDIYRIWGYCLVYGDEIDDYLIMAALRHFWELYGGYDYKGYWGWLDLVTDCVGRIECAAYEDVKEHHLALIDQAQKKRLKSYLSAPLDKRLGGTYEDFRRDEDFLARRAYR